MFTPPPHSDPTKPPKDPGSPLLPPNRVQRSDGSHETSSHVKPSPQLPSLSGIHPAGKRPTPPGPKQIQNQPPSVPLPPQNLYGSPQGHWGTPTSGPGYGQPQDVRDSIPRINEKEKDKKHGRLLGLLKGPSTGYGPGPGYGGVYGQHSGGYGQQPVYVQQGGKHGGGMGGAGMLAAGASAGLLGGLLVADAVDDPFDVDFDDGGDF